MVTTNNTDAGNNNKNIEERVEANINTSANRKKDAKKNTNRIVLFCIITSLFWFSLYSYVPILSVFALELNASVTLAGLIAGSYGFTQMLLRIPLGIASDVLKKRKLFIILGLFFAMISGLGVFIFPNKYSLLIFRSLSGCAASSWVVFSVLFAGYFREDEAPKAIGYLNSFNSLGTLSAQLLGGIVADRFGHKYSFLLAGITAFIAIILGLWIVEKNNTETEPIKVAEIGDVARNKSLILVSILAVFSQFLTFATAQGFTSVVAKELGANEFQIGVLSMLSSLPGLLISPLTGTFFLRVLGARKTIVLGFIISALSCASVPFAGNIYMLYVIQFIGACGRSMIIPLLMGLSIKNFSSRQRATAMGFYQAIYSFGMFIGPVCLGFISDISNMTIAFLATSLVGIIGAITAHAGISKRT